jgi:transposase
MTVKQPEIEVIEPARAGRRRRFSAEEKRRLLEESSVPGNSISSVARKYGLSPSLLFRWRRAFDEGALAGLSAEERVVPESDVKELRHRMGFTRRHASIWLQSETPNSILIHCQSRNVQCWGGVDRAS